MITKSKRDVTFELIRIVACFIVICLHTSTWYISGGSIDSQALLIKCFLQDAVPLFWFIMGYFLFRSKNFSKLFKKAFYQVIIPAFIVMLCSQILAPWLYGKATLMQCLVQPHIDYKNLFGNIIQWKASMTLCGHLWYIFSYIKVILWFPLISYVCTQDEKTKIARYFLFLLTIIGVLITDIQQFVTLPIGTIKPFMILDNSLFYVLLGYEISTRKQTIEENKKKIIPIGGVLFFLANIARYYLTKKLYMHNPSNDYFMHINSIDSFISSISLFLVLLCIFSSFNFNDNYKNFILSISSKTFYIYLIHRGLYEKLENIGLKRYIYSWSNRSFLTDICVMVIYAAIVFLISLLFAYMITTLVNLVKRHVFNK